MRTTTSSVLRIGYLAAALAFLFALRHFAWAAGIPFLGARQEQFDEVDVLSASHLMTEMGIGLLAVLGGVMALAGQDSRSTAHATSG